MVSIKVLKCNLYLSNYLKRYVITIKEFSRGIIKLISSRVLIFLKEKNLINYINQIIIISYT